MATSRDFEVTSNGVRTTTPLPDHIQRCDIAQKAHGSVRQQATEQIRALMALATEKEKSVNDREQRRRAEMREEKPPEFDLFARNNAAARIDADVAKLRRERAGISEQVKGSWSKACQRDG